MESTFFTMTAQCFLSVAISGLMPYMRMSLFSRSRHRRTGQHPFGGGANRVLPEWIRGVVAPDSVGKGVRGRICSVNCSNRPSIRVIQTFSVFCPNNVHSLPEFMSTNCPNWGGGSLRLWVNPSHFWTSSGSGFPSLWY